MIHRARPRRTRGPCAPRKAHDPSRVRTGDPARPRSVGAVDPVPPRAIACERRPGTPIRREGGEGPYPRPLGPGSRGGRRGCRARGADPPRRSVLGAALRCPPRGPARDARSSRGPLPIECAGRGRAPESNGSACRCDPSRGSEGSSSIRVRSLRSLRLFGPPRGPMPLHPRQGRRRGCSNFVGGSDAGVAACPRVASDALPRRSSAPPPGAPPSSERTPPGDSSSTTRGRRACVGRGTRPVAGRPRG